MATPRRILILASEAAPFAKTGGLADVVGSLPKALAASRSRRARGDARSRRHRTRGTRWTMGPEAQPPCCFACRSAAGWSMPACSRRRCPDPRCPSSSSPSAICSTARRFTATTTTRTGLRSSAAPPSIWWSLRSGLAARRRPCARLARRAGDRVAGDRRLVSIRATADCPPCSPSTTCCIKGAVHETRWRISGLTRRRSSRKGPSSTNFMARAIYHATMINTVSPTYAREILTPEYGEGLDALLRYRHFDVHGILNGLDYDVWDPAADTHLASTLRCRHAGETRRQQARAAGATGARRGGRAARRDGHAPRRAEGARHRRTRDSPAAERDCGRSAVRRPRLGRARVRDDVPASRRVPLAQDGGNRALRRGARAA